MGLKISDLKLCKSGVWGCSLLMVSFDYLNSVSRQINSTSALFPLSVPLESLSESFLKASFFYLSLKKKKRKKGGPWVFCTKKGKKSKNTSNCQSKESQMTVFAINHQSTVLWSLECLYLRDLWGPEVMWTCAFKSAIPNFHDKSFQICCFQYSINPSPWPHTVHDRVYQFNQPLTKVSEQKRYTVTVLLDLFMLYTFSL